MIYVTCGSNCNGVLLALAGLLAWLKASAAKAQYGSPAADALPHVFGLLIGKAAGVPMQHAP